VKKTIHFEFSQDLVQQPLLYQINQRFRDDVIVNIRAASVTEQGGFIALELEGDEDDLAKVLGYLTDRGIEVVEGLGESAS
jgi:hypothetical protein